MFGLIDGFFCKIEGKDKRKAKAENKAKDKKISLAGVKKDTTQPGDYVADLCLVFNSKLDKFAKKQLSRGEFLSCGFPSDNLISSGFDKSNEIILTQSVISKAIGLQKGKQDEAHALTIKQLNDLPYKIHNPILIITGDTSTTRLVFIDLVDINKRKVFAAVHFNKANGRILVSDISSIYSKPNTALELLLIAAIAKNEIWYRDDKKIKAWLSEIGQLQLLPKIITRPLGNTKIQRIDEKSKFNQKNILAKIHKPNDCADTRDCISELYECFEAINLLELVDKSHSNINIRAFKLADRFNLLAKKEGLTTDWLTELNKYRNGGLDGLSYELVEEVASIKNEIKAEKTKQIQKNTHKDLEMVVEPTQKNIDFKKAKEAKTIKPNAKADESEIELPKVEVEDAKEVQQTILPRFLVDDIDYNKAYRAYTGTSFDPEKRAKSAQESWANEVNTFAEKLETVIKTAEQNTEAKREFSDYISRSKAKYYAWLGAKSNCISSMITGGANFPIRKAQNANRLEEKRGKEYFDFMEKAEARILKYIKGLDKAGAAAELDEKNEKIITGYLADIAAIVTGKSPYSKTLIVDAFFRKLEKMPREAKQLAIDKAKEYQDKNGTVLFKNNHRFWHMLDGKAETEVTEQTINKTTQTIYKAEGIEIVNNFEAERVQIATQKKPSAEIISYLKKHAFKWSPSNMAWQRQNTQNGIDAALKVAKQFYPGGEKPEPEPEKQKKNEKPTITQAKTNNETVKVENVLVSLINTDAKRFQNRIDAYSEDSKNRIVNAYKAGTFDWSKFDPITIWNDPKNGLWYVLSGHSRLAAFKEIAPLTKRGEDFTRIPVRKFKGTEAEAVDFALNSNTLSTKETEVERALYYNKARQTCELKKDSGAKSDCEKQIKEKVRDSEGKNANYILNLSYLNPNGYLIESLTRLGVEKDNDDTNQARTIANWIGEARRQWHEITDQHETELAKYLLNGGYGNKAGQFKNKTQFNERLRFAIDKWIGNGSKQNDLLNIANTITQSPSEREWNERLFKAKKELDEAINEHEEKHKKYLYALMDGKIDQKRMDELMKPIVLSVDIARKEYERIRGQKDDVVKSSNAQTSLFGIDDINAQFNKELDLLIKGKLPKNHVFYLGDMSDIFNSLGVKILPIEMPVSRLIRKSNQQNHLFDLPLLKNLPEKLNSPIMVFDSKTVVGSLVVLTELTSSDNNFVVAIELDRTYTIWNKGEIEVNDIRSIYPKDNITDVLNWIEKDNLLLWSNKGKSLDLLAGWRSNYANAAQQIKRCTNIIKNFQNPSVLPEKNGDNKTDALDGVTHKAFGFSKIGETKKAKTYKLGGDLGKFLGEYDRLNYSIVLRGDKGAGKSRLLYQIANLFASKKYSVALFSLEMHKDSSISVGYRDSYISKANMKRIDISGESPTFSELDAVCKLYDVVAIDSWTKLKNISQDDFDRLQKLNPRTIIISVFQSTTGKVTRGGNMPEFDASIVIHVHSGGVAKCEKNRYADTRQDYSVFAKKLIEIEEEEVA